MCLLYTRKEHSNVLKHLHLCNSTLSPPKFLKWTLPSLNLDTSFVANRGFSFQAKIENRMANREDSDCLHLDLHWICTVCRDERFKGNGYTFKGGNCQTSERGLL